MQIAERGVGHMNAHTEVASGNFLGEESKIFRSHTHVQPFHLLFAEIGHTVVVHLLGTSIVVHHKRIAIVNKEIAAATHALGYTATDFTYLLVSLHTPFFVESANNALHFHLVGDNVGTSVANKFAK